MKNIVISLQKKEKKTNERRAFFAQNIEHTERFHIEDWYLMSESREHNTIALYILWVFVGGFFWMEMRKWENSTNEWLERMDGIESFIQSQTT
jgi:hypothetical protein